MNVEVKKGKADIQCSPVELNTLRQAIDTFVSRPGSLCPCEFCSQLKEWRDTLVEADDYNRVLNAVTPLNAGR